ncbi:hypothetical protein ACQRIT_005151 [Beauveria bassiana]
MSSHGVPRTERDRSPDQLKKDCEKIDKYRALDSQLRAQTSKSQFDLATLELTTKLLRINPEYYTVWNTRRRCLMSGLLMKQSRKSPQPGASEYPKNSKEPICSSRSLRPTDSSGAEPKQHRPTASQHTTAPGRNKERGAEEGTNQSSKIIGDELIFTLPLLIALPKCYWIWNYRMWTLEQATLLLPVESVKSIWQGELGLVSKMLSRDQRNYHAWAYRRYVVSHLESSELDGQSMVESEFAYTTKMVNLNLSNFSAWHNRAQLIPRLLVERNANDSLRRAFLDEEFSMIDRGLNVGPEDQSLWYYHQYLIFNVAEQPANLAIVPEMVVDDRVKLISRQVDFIKDLLEDYHDVKWIFEMLLEYTLLTYKLRNEPLGVEQSKELVGWVASIKRLDPQRFNRWQELAKKLKIPN